jgi:hypothetical protein
MSLPIIGISGIKISPGIRLEKTELDLETWEREFVGISGECLEQVLWRDSRTDSARITATLIDNGLSVSSVAGSIQEAQQREANGQDLFVEPEAVLIRSGLIGEVFSSSGISLIDPMIAYGVAPSDLVRSPWYRRFEIHEIMPFHLKQVRSRLIELGASSRLEIKRRGHKLEPDQIAKELKVAQFTGQRPLVLFVSRVGNKHLAIITTRLDIGNDGESS